MRLRSGCAEGQPKGMIKKLPPPPPELVAEMDRFHAACEEIFDRYVSGFNIDLNRHMVKHGQISDTEAHYHLTKILAGSVQPNMLAGIAATAIVRGIGAKRKGKG